MKREASSSRKNVTQTRLAKALRRRATVLCYVVPCCVVMGGVVVGACETGIKPTAMISAPDSADQVLLSMSHNITDAGIQRAQVKADTAYLYSPSQTAELRAVTVTFYDVHGAQTSTLTAREGTYHWRGGDMEARGNVVVIRVDGAKLRTEVLRYNQAKNQVTSDKPFVFDEPTRHVEGDGFTSDPDFKNVTASGVHGGVGKLTLPNQ